MEALQYRPPEPFDFDGVIVSAAWRKWRQRFELFLKASGNPTKAADVKVAILLTILGERGVDTYNNFTLRAESAAGQNDGENRDDIGVVLLKFKEFCNRRDPIMALRAQFWSYRRPDGQGLDAFVNDLRTMAANCQFEDTDTMLRDKLFFSIDDANMKMKVMGDDGNAPLDAVLHRMRIFESSRRELQMAGATSSSSSKVVHFVHSNTSKRAPQGDSWRASNSSNARPCGRCGATHPHKQCPAHGKTCHTLPACAEAPNVAKVKVRIIVEANVGVEGVNAVHIVRTQYIRLKRHMKAVTSLLTVFHMRIIMNLHGMPLCTLPLRRWI